MTETISKPQCQAKVRCTCEYPGLHQCCREEGHTGPHAHYMTSEGEYRKDNGRAIQKSANHLIELAISLQAEGNRLYDLVEAEMRKEQVIPKKPEAKQ